MIFVLHIVVTIINSILSPIISIFLEILGL